ncbi:MAG TPA: DUF2339 domain-containing protein, partial [Candidatus Solibacter sp.]|nr:DUF2339 domain-containing protein [Candidatus Solibacter sp.]
MEVILILLSIPAILILRWIFIRERFRDIERKLEEVQAAVRRIEWARAHEMPRTAPAPHPAEPPVATGEREAAFGPPAESAVPPMPQQPEPPAPLTVTPRAEGFLVRPPVAPPRVEQPAAPSAPPEPPPSAAQRPSPAQPAAPAIDWEVLVGGNLLNKLGVFIAVIGIALLLRYAWQHVGPVGRVAMSYATGLAMLGGGIWSETRERFRNFGYGLIGGGWAALYLTTYSMYGIPEAKILDNAAVATVLLLVVAAGMMAHSLKYRSQTVTGLACGIAFFTLAISDVTTFSVLALIPLAIALLCIAYQYDWARFAVFGLVATYFTCGIHKDTGATLSQTQGLFLAYWVLFEAFDLLRPDPVLLPLNALGFLVLSFGKWQHAAPADLWQLAAGASALYVVSATLRTRADRWRPAVTLQAALAVTAIFLKFQDERAPFALLIAGELYYLAGLRFKSEWLRGIAGAVFTLSMGHLLIGEVGRMPLRTWEPVALLAIALFYINRALRAADFLYGFAAVALVALVSGFESTTATVGRV